VIFGSPLLDLLWHIHVYRANNYISWCKKYICLYRVSGILFKTCEHKNTLTRNINI